MRGFVGHELGRFRDDGRVVSSDQFAKMVPVAKVLPQALLPRRQWPEFFADNPNAYRSNFFHISFLPWRADQQLPECRIARTLGACGSIDGETEALLSMFQVCLALFYMCVLFPTCGSWLSCAGV